MNMRSIILPLALLLLTFGILVGQENVQYVAARSGLVIRDVPGTEGEKLGSLAFNTLVRILNDGPVDTIAYRIAPWYLVKADSTGIEGYVFGGYLNRQRIREESYYSMINYMFESVETAQLDFDSKNRTGAARGSKLSRTIRVCGNSEFLLIEETLWEWSKSEIFLYNWELHEVINIVEAAEFYYNRKEYDVFEEFANPTNLNRFSWSIGEVNIGVTQIEKRYPSGVRILFESSL